MGAGGEFTPPIVKRKIIVFQKTLSLSLLDDEHDDNVEDNRFFTFVLTMMMMMWSSLGLFSSCFSTNATHTRGLFCVVFVQANFGQKKLFRVAVTKSKTTIAYFFSKTDQFVNENLDFCCIAFLLELILLFLSRARFFTGAFRDHS